MGDNPLVVDQTSLPEPGALALLGPVDSVTQSATNLASGEWIEGSLMAFQGGMGALGFISDPLGALFSWGVGWLMDHVEPFPTWLDQLCGDPDAIHSFASTWHNVSTRVHDNADTFRSAVTTARGQWEGLSSDAYGVTAGAVATAIDGLGTTITGVAGAVEAAGGLVGGVRTTVKDTISEIVGAIGSALVKFLTVALAADAVRSLSQKVATLSAKIGRFIDDLIVSMGRFGTLLDDVLRFLEEALTKAQDFHKAWGNAPVHYPSLALNTGIQLSRVDDYPTP